MSAQGHTMSSSHTCPDHDQESRLLSAYHPAAIDSQSSLSLLSVSVDCPAALCVVGVIGVAVLATVACWVALESLLPSLSGHVGVFGVIAVFGQMFDGITTIVAIDVFSFTEQVFLSRQIMLVADSLPTAPYLGVGWALLVVKLVVLGGVLALLAREPPADVWVERATLLLVAIVGVVPGMNNLVLIWNAL